MLAARRARRTGFLLGAIVVMAVGCYVVPAPAPIAPGIGPLPPPAVLATPQCRWEYGWGWYGWGWYGVGC
jgi:hypothetical protein